MAIILFPWATGFPASGTTKDFFFLHFWPTGHPRKRRPRTCENETRDENNIQSATQNGRGQDGLDGCRTLNSESSLLCLGPARFPSFTLIGRWAVEEAGFKYSEP